MDAFALNKSICKEIIEICEIHQGFLLQQQDNFAVDNINTFEFHFDSLFQTCIKISSSNYHVLSRSMNHACMYAYFPQMKLHVKNSMIYRGIPIDVLQQEITDTKWLEIVSTVACETMRILMVNKSKLVLRLENIIGNWASVIQDALQLDGHYRQLKSITDERIQYLNYWSMIMTGTLVNLHFSISLETDLITLNELDYFYWFVIFLWHIFNCKLYIYFILLS
jgi:hypothetical protein